MLRVRSRMQIDPAIVNEASALLGREAEVGYNTLKLPEALEALARWLDREDPEKAEQAWDAVRTLAAPLEDARFAAVPEVAVAIARYRALAPRVASELGLMMLAHRFHHPLAEARLEVEAIGRSIDDGDEDSVRRRREALREAIDKLPRELPATRTLHAEAAAAFARSEEELGAHLALEEIEAVERVLVPLIEQVERGIEQATLQRVIDHAPRVAAWLPRLAWYAHHARAVRLADRAKAALARIGALGEGVVRACAEAEAVPAVSPDLAGSARAEVIVRELLRVYAEYRATYQDTQARFETEVDLASGTPESASYHVTDAIDGTARELVRFARRGEELAGELRAIAPDHPALAEVARATPLLIRRVQTWKARLAALAQFSATLDEARQWHDRARDEAEPGADSPHAAISLWPEVLQHVARATEALDRAAAQLPEEPERIAPWRAKLAAIRATAVEQLAAACIAEATRNATLGDMYEAQRFADVLAEAVPGATENQQIAAMIAGTADARARAALEIEAHGALIRRAAEDAARAARPAYDAWVSERPAVTTLAGTIVQNLDAFRGRWIAGRCSHLGLSLADEPGPIRGDMYQIDYDPEVRRHLAEGMARLDAMFESRAKQTAAAAGVDGLCTTTQHYPSDAHYHAEIVGLATYTPVHEVRDVHGSLLATYTGTPYPVPRIVIRAVATRYFVIVPGEPPSLDAMTTAG